MIAPTSGTLRSLAFALACIVGTGATPAFADVAIPPPGAPPLTPEKLYLRAIHAMQEMPQPAFVRFRETIVGRNFSLKCTSDGASISLHHGDVTAAYDVSFRTSDGSALSRPIGVASAMPCPATLLVPAGSGISAMGLPQPSSSKSPEMTPSGAPGETSLGPPIIASLRVEGARFYHIDFVGRERLGANDVDHLKLRAYRDPSEHPLTDLYIDPETFLVREARGEVSGHYVLASGRVTGVIDFDRVGSYWLVEREYFEIAANALLVHAHMTATIDGSNFATPSEMPGIVFPTPRPTASPKARH